MELIARDIAEHLKGTVIGNPDAVVKTMSRIEDGRKDLSVFSQIPNMKLIYIKQKQVLF